MNRVYALAAFVAHLAFASEAMAQPAGATRVAVSALTLPDSVGPYARTARRDFGTRTAGTGYTYAASRDSGRVLLNAFVYERDSAQAALSSSEALAHQAALFRQSLRIEQSRGTLGAYEIPVEGTDTSVVSANGDIVPGYRMVLVLRRGSQAFVSYFSVFAIGDGYIKIRVSVPADRWEDLDAPALAPAIVRRALAGT